MRDNSCRTYSPRLVSVGPEDRGMEQRGADGGARLGVSGVVFADANLASANGHQPRPNRGAVVLPASVMLS